ncbi:hypothetical protein [Bordetella bronchiseptica]|uniref:Exported protein n=1 Tax=Bordetella bronchiseptica (strain ATCC BAA-588 / NCTC 13252 / RB50) TaxID=257310 RepID=A0A0H3LGJ0_BORBR|nr:hypothetical protein [Bordetella bronchiseptica]KAK69108.1 hypothetical protein AZ22_1735 [Bordetella bronchiseptica 980-2]AMG86767.1 hypothetical protein AL472_02255 [Bordetella bronchiseptica]KAB1451536.1 hypothetical protein F7D00_00560 [Bordetella bronchiseptica]KAB1576780.1 hypothetical protein F7890_00560 [Bordetella bronchiseptica]KCV49027.1 hypothetical protein L491_0157 [Bordetella bronchiseptica 3E44]
MKIKQLVTQTLLVCTVSAVTSTAVIYLSKKIDARRQTAAQIVDARERALLHEFASKVTNFEEFRFGYGPGRLSSPCLDKAVEQIRDAGGDVRGAFAECKSSFAAKLPVARKGMSEGDLLAAFIAVVVNRLAPYGSSTASTPAEILAAKTLNCSQHSIMTAALIARYVPDAEVIEKVGLDGGHIGNHALVYYQSKTARMVLDGTSAMITFASIDDILAGKLVSTYDIYDFFQSTDESLEIFRRNVRGAYRLGAVRPEHVIYRESVPLLAKPAPLQANPS